MTHSQSQGSHFVHAHSSRGRHGVRGLCSEAVRQAERPKRLFVQGGRTGAPLRDGFETAQRIPQTAARHRSRLAPLPLRSTPGEEGMLCNHAYRGSAIILLEAPQLSLSRLRNHAYRGSAIMPILRILFPSLSENRIFTQLYHIIQFYVIPTTLVLDNKNATPCPQSLRWTPQSCWHRRRLCHNSLTYTSR